VTLDKDQSALVAAEGKDNIQDAIAVQTSGAADNAIAAGFVRKLPVVNPRSYAKTVLADKPAFYWTFDEAWGPTLEQVRHLPQRALNMYGLAYRRSHRDIGSGLMLGRAADFTGGDGFFAADATGIGQGEMPGAWAIEFWVQFTGDLAGSTNQYVLNLGGSGGSWNNPSIIFDFESAGTADNELQLLGGGDETQGGPQIVDTQWHHVLFVFYGDGDKRGVTSRADVLLDGRQRTLDRGTVTSRFDLAHQLLVGSDTTEMGCTLHGRLDELAFYDLSGLTVEQVQARAEEMARRHINAARPNKKGFEIGN